MKRECEDYININALGIICLYEILKEFGFKMGKFKKEKLEVIDDLKEEIEDIIYKKPKNDFEHIWNCAIDKCLECFNGYENLK